MPSLRPLWCETLMLTATVTLIPLPLPLPLPNAVAGPPLLQASPARHPALPAKQSCRSHPLFQPLSATVMQSFPSIMRPAI
jgi:hypothetical protein